MEFHVVPQLGDVFALGKPPLTGNWSSVIVLDLDDLQAPSNPNHPVQTGSEVCQASMCVLQINSAGFKMKCFHLGLSLSGFKPLSFSKTRLKSLNNICHQ